MSKPNNKLEIDFCGVKFENPFCLSSSPVSNTGEMIGRAFEAGWGGVFYKALTNSYKTKIIHPSPRMAGYENDGQKLVGLHNVEQTTDRTLEENLADFLYLKKKYPKKVLVSNIMGFSNDEWEYLAKISEDNGADMLELNFSCPHMTVEGAGAKVGQADDLVEKFTTTVRRAVSIPIVAKLTPNVTDITTAAIAAKNGGADAFSTINTIKALSMVNPTTLHTSPDVGGIGSICGYSGPACKPIALRFIAELAKDERLNLPISGMGGIETWEDALSFIALGASVLQVTTGIIHYGYRIVEDMIEGLQDYMEEVGVNKLADLVGRSLPTVKDTGKFNLNLQGKAEYDLDKCIGCGQCYTVCHDSGGQAIEWDAEKRRPRLLENKCLSCMVCSFVCPVDGLITYKKMPADWKREEALFAGEKMKKDIKLKDFDTYMREKRRK